jgi:hypothetical protein
MPPSAAPSAATLPASQPTARRASKKPKQTATTEKATTNDVSLFGDRK